jgi:hypothetical protein
VEIVPGDLTSPETVEATRALMERLGKTPVVVKKEVAGYLGNKIQSAVLQVARDIVESGIATVEEVGLAVSTGIGLRWALYGPFAVTYFNTPSHLIDRYGLSGLVAEGFQEHSLMKGKTFDEMVRWRDGNSSICSGCWSIHPRMAEWGATMTFDPQIQCYRKRDKVERDNHESHRAQELLRRRLRW